MALRRKATSAKRRKSGTDEGAAASALRPARASKRTKAAPAALRERPRMLTKSTDWQSVEKACKQGNFANGKICRQRRLDLTIPKGSANPPKEAVLASKGAYIDVSDRRMQVQLTQEAKIVSDFYSIRAIFAFVGFVSALRPLPQRCGSGPLWRGGARSCRAGRTACCRNRPRNCWGR